MLKLSEVIDLHVSPRARPLMAVLASKSVRLNVYIDTHRKRVIDLSGTVVKSYYFWSTTNATTAHAAMDCPTGLSYQLFYFRLPVSRR